MNEPLTVNFIGQREVVDAASNRMIFVGNGYSHHLAVCPSGLFVFDVTNFVTVLEEKLSAGNLGELRPTVEAPKTVMQNDESDSLFEECLELIRLFLRERKLVGIVHNDTVVLFLETGSKQIKSLRHLRFVVGHVAEGIEHGVHVLFVERVSAIDEQGVDIVTVFRRDGCYRKQQDAQKGKENSFHGQDQGGKEPGTERYSAQSPDG